MKDFNIAGAWRLSLHHLRYSLKIWYGMVYGLNNCSPFSPSGNRGRASFGLSFGQPFGLVAVPSRPSCRYLVRGHLVVPRTRASMA